MLLLTIPEPCHENWNEMLATEKGAFCTACSKVVIDFSSLNDEEIKTYFLQNIEQKTCGRFKNTQLSSPEKSLDKLLSGSIPFWKKFLAIVVILFGTFLTGCEHQTKGKVEAQQKEETTTGVTLTEIKPNLGIGKTQVEGCSIDVVTVPPTPVIDVNFGVIKCDFGYTTGTPAIVLIPEKPNDSSYLSKKIDSIKTIISIEKKCDNNTTTDSTIYYIP